MGSLRKTPSIGSYFICVQASRWRNKTLRRNETLCTPLPLLNNRQHTMRALNENQRKGVGGKSAPGPPMLLSCALTLICRSDSTGWRQMGHLLVWYRSTLAQSLPTPHPAHHIDSEP